MEKQTIKLHCQHANENEHDIKCDCGKRLAIERGGKIYAFCKSCKCEQEIFDKTLDKIKYI